MKRVFADAFFYLAVLNRNDAAHRRSMEAVMAEGWKRFLRRNGPTQPRCPFYGPERAR